MSYVGEHDNIGFKYKEKKNEILEVGYLPLSTICSFFQKSDLSKVMSNIGENVKVDQHSVLNGLNHEDSAIK